MASLRIGIDFGGTKFEIIALDQSGAVSMRRRVPNPGHYDGAIRTLVELVHVTERELGGTSSVGVGIPGAISPDTGLVKNANSTWLNGQPFGRDLGEALGRGVRVENDANCFTLSEASDGAAAAYRVVFGVILGTGVGGGITVGGQLITGPHHIAGEWGHTPLPWARIEEFPMPACFCGNVGCIERFLCGPALAESCDGPGHHDASGLPARAEAGDPRAKDALDKHVERLSRALAQLVTILDPDAIVFGGGLSNMKHLYTQLPPLIARHVVSPSFVTPLLANMHGDSSGVRGAAWLWPPSD